MINQSVARPNRKQSSIDGRTEQVTTTPVQHMTFDDEYFASPEAAMAQLAAQGPIHRFSAPQGINGWMITSYDLAREVFTDTRIIKTPETMNGSYVQDTTGLSRRSRFNRWANGHIVSHMLGSQPPDHDRLRGLVTEQFSPRAIGAREPRITQLADELLDRMMSTGIVDLSAAYAVPLPVQITAEITGVPTRHADRIVRSSAAHCARPWVWQREQRLPPQRTFRDDSRGHVPSDVGGQSRGESRVRAPSRRHTNPTVGQDL